MTSLEYSSVDEQVISTNPIFHRSSANGDLGLSLNFSDLPAQQAPALISWSLIPDQELNRFPNAQNNSNFQQTSRQHDSEAWIAWVLGRDVFLDADVPLAFPTSPVLACSPSTSFSTLDFSSSLNHFQSRVTNIDYLSSAFPQTSGDLPSVHGRLLTNLINGCSECSTIFPTKTALDLHSKESNHSPHSCLCGKRFSRLDVLDRHIHSSYACLATAYPCLHCRKYRGTRAFRRRDHLTQHLRKCHHMEVSSDSDAPLLFQHRIPRPRKQRTKLFSCAHESCVDNQKANFDKVDRPNPAKNTFQTQSQLTQHIREVHNESLFPCREAYCSRIGGNGFFRKKDLIKHMREHHNPRPGGCYVECSSCTQPLTSPNYWLNA